jgi:hypothetical protein
MPPLSCGCMPADVRPTSFCQPGSLLSVRLLRYVYPSKMLIWTARNVGYSWTHVSCSCMPSHHRYPTIRMRSKVKKQKLYWCIHYTTLHYTTLHYAFLTSAVSGDKWSDSRPGRLTPRERAPGTHWIGGWVSPRAGLDTVVKRIPSPCRVSNPWSSSP